MKTKFWAIGLVLSSAVLTSIAQVFYKLAAQRLVYSDIITYLTNYPLIIALILFGVGGVLLVHSFKGGDVTVLYPLFATSYVFVMLLSRYLFGELITSHKWVGVAIIILGITVISIGNKREKHPAIEYEPGAI